MTSGNEYVLQVKGNQPKLRAAIAALHAADPTPAGATHRHDERRDGRPLCWQTSVYPAAPHWQADWAGVARCVVVVKTVVGPHATTRQTRYYLTSLRNRSAADFAVGIRGHWGIENKLHRTRDVHFNQDTNGIRHRVAAVNAALFNTLALNFLLTNVDASISYAQLFFAQNFKYFMP
ncbi:ISAs1 family transposase [Hymenobacter siberiensis]|uniref:ISAs1 family transposase n=1 Tax=Hymenobacter siberiensis TaxID=2848396 RepID=UPI001C1E1024|nr:ISAs1 family transposase [Hymenobacter siberiensis]MBU6120601.1 ISAs1 family transposase [Hymenobacter siberiensis]